ncbi:hypothetical protein GGR57DRAFT_496901 [Xylariaceae sp. FL1272]|nr:hypothetical protein GGR57DRAFT_496901 [Xylariaceae sp. FL1272]
MLDQKHTSTPYSSSSTLSGANAIMYITNIFTTVGTFLLLASSAQATYELAVFQDGECQTPVDGQATTQVLSGTCDNNVKAGYSSFKVLHKWASPAGTITFFELPACAYDPFDKTARYHNPDENKCYTLGFTANAVHLIG